MKKIIKIVYWLTASILFLLLWYSEYKKSKLRHIDVVTSDEDSVLFYFSYNEKQIYKEGLNKVNESLNILID